MTEATLTARLNKAVAEYSLLDSYRAVARTLLYDDDLENPKKSLERILPADDTINLVAR